MANKEVLDYIEKELKKDFSIKKIKKKLLDAGYSKNAVEGGIREAKKTIKPKINKSYIFAVIIILVILVIIIWFIQTRKPLEIDGDTQELIEDLAVKYATKTIEPLCMALITNKIDYCEYIEEIDDRNSCYENFYIFMVMKTKNKELCQNIKDDDTKLGCQLFVDENIAGCGEFDNIDDKNYCEALLKGDISLCENIDDPGTRISCQDDSYFNKAIQTGDISTCDKLSTRDIKVSCFGFVKQDDSFCVLEMKKDYDYVYREVAILKNNMALCGKIKDRGVREDCYSSFGK